MLPPRLMPRPAHGTIAVGRILTIALVTYCAVVMLLVGVVLSLAWWVLFEAGACRG